MRFGLLSTYPPTRCGLATFNAALAGSLIATGASAGVVRVAEPADLRLPVPVTGGEEVTVTHNWSTREADGWRAAADALNAFDTAIIQHEYGIYPGADGADVLRLHAPAPGAGHRRPAHGAQPAVAAAEVAAGADRRRRRPRS